VVVEFPRLHNSRAEVGLFPFAGVLTDGAVTTEVSDHGALAGRTPTP